MIEAGRKFIKQSPSWEANSRLADEAISGPLWNTKVYYSADKSGPLVPASARCIESTLYFLKIHFSRGAPLHVGHISPANTLKSEK
jgi:hypothetical protein